MGNVLSRRRTFQNVRSQLEKSLRRAAIRLSVTEHLPLEDIYVELTVLSAKDLRALFDAAHFVARGEDDAGIGSLCAGEYASGDLPKVSFNELFENVRGDDARPTSAPVQNILAYGGAGSGKTTAFLLALVYQWLHRRVLKGKFDLMVPFELRDKDVQKADSLDELFSLQLSSLGYDNQGWFQDLPPARTHGTWYFCLNRVPPGHAI